MPIQVKNGQTILFVGDSITDCGRRGTERPLGNGYVKQFVDLLTIREPAKRICVINKGIGGDQVTSLRNRWTDDVMRHRPDWLSVKVGINDLHGYLFGDSKLSNPTIYREAYDEILARTVDRFPRCQILLIDPFYISTDRAPHSPRQQVLKALPEYLKIVHAMSRKYRTRLVKTHEIFQTLLKAHESDEFCGEPVHPNLTGHLAIADAVYQALSK